MQQDLSVKLRASPHLLIPGTLAWLRGWWYRIKFALQFKRVKFGKFLRVYGPLNISGPGYVEFGDRCLIISNAIKPVCIRTLSSNAKVVLKDDSGLNGTSIQCVELISIGAYSTIADAYITDTPAHSIDARRRSIPVMDIPASPVRIGNNVWISVGCVVTDGVTIGDDSVVSACSLVHKSIPAGVVVAGNPARIIRDVPGRSA